MLSRIVVHLNATLLETGHWLVLLVGATCGWQASEFIGGIIGILFASISGAVSFGAFLLFNDKRKGVTTIERTLLDESPAKGSSVTRFGTSIALRQLLCSHLSRSSDPLKRTSRREKIVNFVLAGVLFCGIAEANEHLSGLWYDPSSSGDGFNVTVVERPGESPVFFVFYYGYDKDGHRMWLVSDTVELKAGTQSYSIKMFYALGHGFQGAGNHSLSDWGSLDISFTKCGTGNFTLKQNNQVIRTWNATQLADIPGPGCLLGDGPRRYQTIAGLSGPWFKANEPGDGFNIVITNSGLVAFFYGYDGTGSLLWLVSETYFGPILPGQSIELNMLLGSGGYLSDVSKAKLSVWGKLSIFFKDCSSAEARLEGTDGIRFIDLVQLAQPADTLCEAPGTIELSKPTVTLEKAGDIREVAVTVRDYLQRSSSIDMIEIDVEDLAKAKVNSITDDTVHIEATTDITTSTKVTFWDPVTNGTQELSIAIVDLQPGVIWIPYDLVESWEVPLPAQTTEILLTLAQATQDLAVGSIIASEGGLIGKIQTISQQAETVAIEAGFVAIPDVYRNLQFAETLSTFGRHELSGVRGQVSALSSNPEFSISKPQAVFGVPSCKWDSGALLNNLAEIFAEPPVIRLGHPSTKLDTTISIVEGQTISEKTGIFVESLLLGDVRFMLAPGAANPQLGFKCTWNNEELYVVPTPTQVGVFAGKISLGPGVDVFAEAVPEGRLIWDLGMKLRCGINFKSGVECAITGGLQFGDYITPRAVHRTAPGSVLEIKPLLKGSFGISYLPPPLFVEGLTLGLADTEVGFPFTWLWELPSNPSNRDYQGPYSSVLLSARASIQASLNSDLLDLAKFFKLTKINVGPSVNLFDWQKTLSESPKFTITPLSCGTKCGIGDPRRFKLDVQKEGIFRKAIAGDAYLLGFSSSSIVTAPSRYIAGSAPMSSELEIIPASAGELTVAPRFASKEDGVVFGGTPVTVNVTGGTPSHTVSVSKSGSGTVTSLPAGIDCGTSCSADFLQNTSVTLTARAADGWSFSSWTGACSGSQDTCTVAVETDLTVNASFIEDSNSSLTTPLNDTGIDWGWNGAVLTDYAICAGYSISAQDCSHGRDATHHDHSDGHAGFSFTKLDQNGNALPASAENWACVRDEVTGLTWEAKADNAGLRDAGNTYSWYDPNPNTNGGFPGYADRGNCASADCDTYGYVQAVNSMPTPLCGSRDWRVPTRPELRSIVNYSGTKPTIDTRFFRFQVSGSFWTSHPDVTVDGNAWSIDFRSGFDDKKLKSNAYYVRLVRGPQ